jgi:hypothetical protein
MILCSHSKITVPPETYFITPLVDRLPINQELNEEQVASAVEIITGHYRWPDMGMSKEKLVACIQKDNPHYLRDIVDIVYNYHLTREHKQIWGDKTPPYISIVPQLLELFPDARIINLIRDGRDVTKSFQATGWYGPWLHKNTYEWKTSISTGERLKSTSPNIDIYELKYEDLILDTEKTVRRLCDHLSIEFETGMLDWRDTVNGKIPAREAHIHTKISRKPGKRDVYRWKSEMSKREILVVESFISSELTSAGYPLYYSGALWNPVFHACRAWYEVIFPDYAFVLRLFRYAGRKLGIVN